MKTPQLVSVQKAVLHDLLVRNIVEGKSVVDNNFVFQRHAAFDTPESIIFGFIQEDTGLAPLSRKKIVQGYDNEVYLVHTTEEDIILRIRRHGEVGFREEAWAIEQCRSAGIGVPKIWTVQKLNLGESISEVMIQSVVPGRPLGEWMDVLSADEITPLLTQAGFELAKIHSIVVKGFYQYHGDGIWDFQLWEQVCDSVIENRGKEEPYIREAGFSRIEFEFMMDMLHAYPHRFPCSHPVLCHGDFLPRHIFFDDDHKLTGVIDFGMFQGGPVIHDFAMYSLNRPDQEMFAIVEGYASLSAQDPEFIDRLHMHRLSLAMGFLAHELRIGDRENAVATSRKLRQSLEWLKGR